MSEPKVLLLPSVVLSGHFQIQFYLCFVFCFMHEEGDFKGIVRNDIVVLFNDLCELFGAEVGKQVHYEFFIVLQDYDPKLLKDVAKLNHLYFWCIDHHMQRIDQFVLREELVFDDLHKHIDETAIVDLIEVSMV